MRILWVPGHSGVEGNEHADRLARQGSQKAFLGPEPVLGMPKSEARRQMELWARKQHLLYWEKLPGLTYSKRFIDGPSCKRKVELLSMSRNQIRLVVGLLTGHMSTRTHLRRIKKYDGDLSCRLCGKEPETSMHILCSCEALAKRRQCLFGQPFMEPKEYHQHPAVELCRLIQGTKFLDWV